MPGASAQVDGVFSAAAGYADAATGALTGFTNALSGSIYSAPSVSIAWQSPAPPPVPTIPLPSAPIDIIYTAPGSVPSAFSEPAPTIDIDAFAVATPSVSLPTAPTVSYGTAPTVPAVTSPTMPTIDALVTPTAPTFLTLSTVSFGGVDMHEAWLTKFEDIPTLELLAPTPYSYARGPEYASALLSGLQAKLAERLAGGTGLSPAVEQAIWDRARSRETTTAQANQDEIMRASEAFGFQLPAGVLAAQMREAQQGYYDKLSTLSRDVAIKQAELEQENLKQTIAQGMELEGKLIDYSYKMEQLTFETAKAYADNALQIYNAATEQYKALLASYQTYAAAYKTIIDAELTKVEVYKAELVAEQTKAQVNNALVQQYKAQIEANMAFVEIYKAELGGANALIQLEQTKIGAAGEQIKAYVAQVNAETAKVEAYKAQVQAEMAGVDIYKSQVQAYSARVSAQAEEARARISRFSALSQAKTSEWEGYKAQVGAESERIRALGIQASTQLEGYKASAAAAEAQGNVNARFWESSIKQYEGGINLTLAQAKINTDVVIQTNNARLEAAKAGAQTYAQLASSAYGMMNASASISGNDSMSISYSYSNDTAGAASTREGF
jgi:hypothetical protein